MNTTLFESACLFVNSLRKWPSAIHSDPKAQPKPATPDMLAESTRRSIRGWLKHEAYATRLGIKNRTILGGSHLEAVERFAPHTTPAIKRAPEALQQAAA